MRQPSRFSSDDGGTNYTTLSSTLAGTATSYTDGALADDKDYFYRVRAVRPSGPSAWTDPADASTAAAVSDLAATAISTSEIALSWTDNIANPTNLEIDRSTDGVNFTPLTIPVIVLPSATGFDDTGLTEGQHYYYKVRLSDASGAYSFSNIADATTEPIQDLANTPLINGQILTWSNFSTNATAIEIYRATGSSTTFTRLTTLSDGTATAYFDGGLPANTEYQYKVRAIEPAGPSHFTDPLDTFTLPIAPTNLVVTSVSTTQVSLSWTGSGSSATAYYIERSDDGGTTFSIIDITDPGVTTYTDASVTDGASYVYNVDAVSGDSVNYNPSLTTASANLPVAVPTDISAVANGQTEIDLTWKNKRG
jgi:titin